MIASKYRFHGQNGLLYVYRKGRTVRTKHAQAKFTINPKRQDYRASVVISKKVTKIAPMRNRIRRRIYEQIRLQAPTYLANHDVVVTVFDPELALCEAHEIESLVTRLLKSIRAMSKQPQ